jgi:hypothetical protein
MSQWCIRIGVEVEVEVEMEVVVAVAFAVVEVVDGNSLRRSGRGRERDGIEFVRSRFWEMAVVLHTRGIDDTLSVSVSVGVSGLQ